MAFAVQEAWKRDRLGRSLREERRKLRRICSRSKQETTEYTRKVVLSDRRVRFRLKGPRWLVAKGHLFCIKDNQGQSAKSLRFRQDGALGILLHSDPDNAALDL